MLDSLAFVPVTLVCVLVSATLVSVVLVYITPVCVVLVVLECVTLV